MVEADAIDLVALAAGFRRHAGVGHLPDSDAQSNCRDVKPLGRRSGANGTAVGPTQGQPCAARRPTDNVANYAKKAPLSPQLVGALDQFITK